MPTRKDTFDASSFLRGLQLADARVQKGVRRAFAKLLAFGEKRGKELCPIDQRKDASGGTLAATITGDAATIAIDANGATGLLTAGGGEASDYAVVQHEDVLTHTHPESGVYASKYIEQPLKEMSDLLGPTVAREVKAELGGS